jgi:ABC-type Fe3+ transport system permease subunit
MSTSSIPVQVRRSKSAAERSPWRRFFKSGREDSPFKLTLVHGALLFACALAVYPVLRVLSVSLRPGDRLLSTSLAIVPPDATLQAYVTVLTEKAFLLWLWNSLVITAATAIIGVILALIAWIVVMTAADFGATKLYYGRVRDSYQLEQMRLQAELRRLQNEQAAGGNGRQRSAPDDPE